MYPVLKLREQVLLVFSLIIAGMQPVHSERLVMASLYIIAMPRSKTFKTSGKSYQQPLICLASCDIVMIRYMVL